MIAKQTKTNKTNNKIEQQIIQRSNSVIRTPLNQSILYPQSTLHSIFTVKCIANLSCIQHLELLCIGKVLRSSVVNLILCLSQPCFHMYINY